MARNFLRFPPTGYWPPPDLPELPPVQDLDPFGILEARDKAQREVRPAGPPCKVMKVAFQQLRILEVYVEQGGWAGTWEQHLMVAQINGDPDQVVAIDLADHRTGLGPIQVPIEVPLSHTEYVRVRRASAEEIIRAAILGLGPYIPFTVASGGTAEFGLLRVGTVALPHAENVHGVEDWKMGRNTLTGSANGLTYEVTYDVSCAPVRRFPTPFPKVIAAFVDASPVGGQTGAQIGMHTVSRILRRLGYAIVEDRGSGAERVLEIEGPGDYDALLKALRPGRAQAGKGKG